MPNCNWAAQCRKKKAAFCSVFLAWPRGKDSKSCIARPCQFRPTWTRSETGLAEYNLFGSKFSPFDLAQARLRPPLQLKMENHIAIRAIRAVMPIHNRKAYSAEATAAKAGSQNLS